MNTATKHVLIDPEDDELEGITKENGEKESLYASVACRFSSNLHPQKKKINDKVTLVAIGNFSKVLIFAVMSNNS